MNDKNTTPLLQHLTPLEAWDFLQQTPNAILIDVRMTVESLYVGRPPGAINIPWYEFPNFQADEADFVASVKREVGVAVNGAETQVDRQSFDATQVQQSPTAEYQRPLVLICRSGMRTVDAGEALLRAGFTKVMSVLHGFEGERDARDHRSTLNGWRYDGLPWEQM